MHRNHTTKKRKHDGPLDDCERTLYASFSSAANGISQLYTQSLNQQRKAYCLGARHVAEKVVQWLEAEHSAEPSVSANELVALLREELDVVEGCAAELASVPVPGTVPSVHPSQTQTERAQGYISADSRHTSNNGRLTRHAIQAEAKQRVKPAFSPTMNLHPAHLSEQPHGFPSASVPATCLTSEHQVAPGPATSPCPME
mmetsp:Transcript_22217/g.48783  ORF Transcript_22217/g.48783 Transcript_22217/m.48783 type:complete len:200 (+) Transcript_22217:219-818(+)|eukprot:CAMPEP_0118922254 /NCGR_PEP_ID=MMETSP1169-20130426/1243_1 /TAXON_ID=36882 /ORGANISM="Pyramimonas obovata, Strain CCMP722" /LENGTH=199 /DNA_ID=CAMNT_0006863091 /DNA_START=210 /DNA_END=809 /DNA_ORIENTATION=-